MRAGFLRLGFLLASLGSGDKTIQIVTIGPVGAEGLLVEEPFDAAAQANLVGMALRANWPTRPAMPAAAKNENSGAGQAGREQSQMPGPSRFWF